MIAYTCVGLLALPSDLDRAMREASTSRTATDTDSYAFFVLMTNANEGMTAARNIIMDKIWICTAKKQVGKLPKGAFAEIIKHGTTAPPNDKEISTAFETKYSLKIPNGLANKSNFDIVCK